eukprot:jgi/Psemu1/39086/gm1.39086_g
MSSIPIGRRTRSKSTGRFLSLQPGSAANQAPLTPPTIMAPNQQDNPSQDNEEDVPISDLFPSFDQPLATFLRDSFDAPKESNSTLCEALIASQYKTWLDFLYIENIGDLAYLERGTRTPLSRNIQLNLQRVIDFGRHLTEQGLDWEDRNHYTKDAFKDYCRGIVKARRESAVDGGVVARTATPPPDGQGRSTKPIEQLKYESWIRKSRDETTFPALQNDARFEHWLVKFKAKLETSDIDTHTFLNPNWPDIPLTGYTKALHDKQCAFFWTLVLHVFQSDLSSSCVLSHTTTRDGRQAFFDFVTLHDKSKSKVYDTSIVMQHLLNIDLRSWKDTKVKFITQWFAQLEHLNTLRDPQRPLDYDTVKTHLCKACSSSFQLSEQFCKVDDPPAAQDMIPTRLDSQAFLSQPSSRTSVKANAHDFSSMTQSTYSAITNDMASYLPPIEFDGDYQDYAVYKAGQTPEPSTRLPSTVWRTLSKHGMKHWLGFQADDKKKIPITRRAYEHHTDEQKLSPEEEASARSAFHESLGVYKATSQSDNRPFKSSVSPAHPARFLADNPDVLYQKEGSVYVPAGQSSLSANFHHWSPLACESCVSPATPVAVYHSSKTNVSTSGYAMVDHGANGCIIGNDACLISKDIPPCYVNVTGIDNHQIQNIPIATCGAYSVSNRGPVIIIFHECAYTGQHPSILSFPQMEAYFSLVDDTSIKAGGIQVITATDGHVFPLSICHGLPYIAMLNDQQWNPSVLDGAYTTHDDTFIQKYPPLATLLPYQDYDEFGAPRGANLGTSPAVNSFILTDYIHQEVLSRCSICSPSNCLTVAPHIQSPTDMDYLTLKPFFGWVSIARIKATFNNSTQYGSLSISSDGNIFKRFQSPQPAMNIGPFNDDVLSDVIYSDTPAINGGSKLAQVFFGRKSHIIHVEETTSRLAMLSDVPNFQYSKHVGFYTESLSHIISPFLRFSRPQAPHLPSSTCSFCSSIQFGCSLPPLVALLDPLLSSADPSGHNT